MERKIVDRRTVLKGGAAAVGMLGSGASASMVAGVQQASADSPPFDFLDLTPWRNSTAARTWRTISSREAIGARV